MKHTPHTHRARRQRAQEKVSRALCAFLSVCALSLLGCNKEIPDGKSAIDQVKIRGVPSSIEEPIEEGLATRPTQTFLGIEGIYEYETFDEAALEKDILRVERQLRRRGYYEARVSAARVIRTQEQKVRVELAIDAGEPVLIKKLETVGLAQLPFEAAEAATNEMSLRVDTVFDEDQFEKAKVEVANALADRGYAYAEVDGSAEIDLAAHSAHVKIIAKPGKRVRVGNIEVKGLRKVAERPIRRTLLVKKDDWYSRKELNSARAALFELGVFSVVEIVPDLSDKSREDVPVRVVVQESAMRDVTLGGGARLDLLRLAGVAQGGWTHRNFLGGLRKFSVTTRPGLTFFPTSVERLQAPVAYFPENFLTVRLEQPGVFEARTRGYTQAGYNVYPLLYPLAAQADPRAQTVIGYNEITAAIGARRSFWGRLLTLDLSTNWQANFPFLYQGESLVNGLDTVIVTYPEFITEVDLRDDPIEPTTGLVFTNSIQTALPTLGGQLQDVRWQPELATFVPLDQKHKVVLATRFTVGMLFPKLDPDGGRGVYGNALLNSEGSQDFNDPDIVADQHRMLFRAFYSGGANSNRGYAYNRVGPQGAIGFLLPSNSLCDEPPEDLPSGCIRPLGGFTLWEASAEIRYRFANAWALVAFVDASDVSTRRAHFTLAEPHVSVGPGLRYISPVGPIRIDIGIPVPGLQALDDNPSEPPDISEVPPYTNPRWYNRFALQILIGEAF